MDVLEDVGRKPVERVGLAIVADDQPIGGLPPPMTTDGLPMRSAWQPEMATIASNAMLHARAVPLMPDSC